MRHNFLVLILEHRMPINRVSETQGLCRNKHVAVFDASQFLKLQRLESESAECERVIRITKKLTHAFEELPNLI